MSLKDVIGALKEIGTFLKDMILDLIGSIIRWFCGMFLHRTGYRAMDTTGKVVTGCYECRHNLIVHSPICDAHQCEVSVGPDCKPLMIFDPYDVPELCTMRIPEPENA